MGLDDMGTAPGWIWVGDLGWLGIFFVYPAWCVWFGREPDRGWVRAARGYYTARLS